MHKFNKYTALLSKGVSGKYSKKKKLGLKVMVLAAFLEWQGFILLLKKTFISLLDFYKVESTIYSTTQSNFPFNCFIIYANYTMHFPGRGNARIYRRQCLLITTRV